MFAFGRKKEKSLKTEGSITSTGSTNEKESKEEKERRKKEKKEAKKAAKQGTFFPLLVSCYTYISNIIFIKSFKGPFIFLNILYCRAYFLLCNWSFKVI